MSNTENDCNHKWSSNDGAGGEPEFKTNNPLPTRNTMWVVCVKCQKRMWLSPGEWEAFGQRDKTTTDPI